MAEAPHPAIQPGNAAVVTGGASGIGLAAAQAFSALGMNVCLADRDEAALAAAKAGFVGGGKVETWATDVADSESVDRLAQFVDQIWGTPAVLMNNAGIGGGGDALSNPDGWRAVLGVNLIGMVNGVQRFVPAMVEREGPGLVINTGSKQGITQPPGDTAYNVSKSGVKSLTEGLAHTLREKTGGRVTAHLLIPGFTYTGIMKRYIAEHPPAAWSPEQVAERMMEGLARDEFYILCEDNEVTREIDEKRIRWAADDVIQNRPALSRWHPDWADRFEKFMAE